MGSKLSSLFSKKSKRVQYSPRTAQKMETERRTGKLIHPPLSSMTEEKPLRSLLPNGELLYKGIYMEPELDQHSDKYDDQERPVRPHRDNYYKKHDDGTFSVLSRHHPHDQHVFSV